MRLLLVYYHPIILDLAETFKQICDKVTIAVNLSIKDNYGTGIDVISRVKQHEFLQNVDCIPLQLALQKIKTNEYDLVGCDGVFDGDKLIMDACKESNIPWFCINGYPHNFDEPSQNILSFSWFLPQIQYKQKYPSESHIKEIDWKNFAEKGQSESKNIFVFYPELNYAKRYYEDVCYTWSASKKFISLIHRFEECNKWSYEVFKKVKQEHPVENYSSLDQHQTLRKIYDSRGLLHLKHGDCPGISVFESLLLERPVFTLKSFINASFNQEILIDKFNALVADDVDELIERMKRPFFIQRKASDYIYELTSLDRQRNKLERFLNKCFN